MITAGHRHCLRAAAGGLLLILSACSGLDRLPPADRSVAQLEAQAVLQQLALTNASLSSFKGLGRIKVRNTDQAPLSRRAVARVASMPETPGLAAPPPVGRRTKRRPTANSSIGS
ncbi:MAG: hypothetical protein U5R30_12800 [Deltaproteobacteria bacterium]|nr:hypothetical protein [Deltaproteobacteria bacterium]